MRFPASPLGPVTEFLPAAYRFAGDDWSGDSAFTFVRWITEPVLASDGVTVTTPGVPRDLTGCSVRGLLYRRALLDRLPLGDSAQAPIALAGDLVDATAGEFELTLAQASTGLAVQDRHDACARYVLRALLADPSGRETTVGIVPVFVL